MLRRILLSTLLLSLSAAPALAYDGYLNADLGAPPGSWGLVSAPAAATYASPPSGVYDPGPVLAAVQGQDNALWVRLHDGGWWGWASLGGLLQSKPSIASTKPGQWVVVVRGVSNRVWMRRYTGWWSGWEEIAGKPTLLAPAVTSRGDGSFDVFVTGLDKKVYWRRFDGSTWGEWSSLGGELTSAPAAVAHPDGKIDVFARGADKALWHRQYRLIEGGKPPLVFSIWSWTGWKWLDGGLAGDPIAARTVDGRVDVFVRGTDNGVYQKTRLPGGDFGGYTWLFGPVASDIGVASAWAEGFDPTCRYHLFVKDTDSGQLSQRYCVADAAVVPVYRNVKRHVIGGVVLDTLLTRDPGEGLGLDMPDGVYWASDGQAFQCHDGPAPGTVPLRRVYRPGSADQHVFVTGSAALAAELAAGAIDEGTVCWVYPTTSSPDWYGPHGSCALWSMRHGSTGFYTLDAYLAEAMNADGYFRFFDGFAWPTFGRLGFAFSKNGSCGVGDEGPPPAPGPTDPPPPPAEETASVLMNEVAIFEGFRAYLLEMPSGIGSKVVKSVNIPLTGLTKEFRVGFLPPGVSSEECMTSDKIVWIDQGGTLEGAALTKVTGMTSPPWSGFRLAACGQSLLSTGALPSGFWLKVTLM